MSAGKRPGKAELSFRTGTGQVVNREGPIVWLSPAIGFADVPTLVIGETMRVLCIWDGTAGQMVPTGSPPLSTAIDALILLTRDTGKALSDVRRRLAKLEGFAAGETAEAAANAPAPASRAEAEKAADDAMRAAGADAPPKLRILGSDGEPA